MSLKTYTPEELGNILELHKKWLRGDADGVRADLREADLSEADLRKADLSKAYLRGANLSDADLSEADLSEADLRKADLSKAYLWGANLRDADLFKADLSEADLRKADLCGAVLWDVALCGANLSEADLFKADLWGANLSEADLRKADLRKADLRGAKLEHTKGLPPIACPEIGSFIGFKQTRDAIVTLEILDDARRSSATGRKCRCDKARVLSITDFTTGDTLLITQSKHDPLFFYRVGEIVSVDNFDPDRWNECAPGIHFFITRQEAVDY